jgi:hypothetical protein
MVIAPNRDANNLVKNNIMAKSSMGEMGTGIIN